MQLLKTYRKFSSLLIVAVFISCSKEVPNTSNKVLTKDTTSKDIVSINNKSSISSKKNTFKIAEVPYGLVYGNNWSEITETETFNGTSYVLVTPDNLVQNNEPWISTKYGTWNTVNDDSANGNSYLSGSLLENDNSTLNYQPRTWNLVNDINASGGSYSELSGNIDSFLLVENDPVTPKLLYNKGAINWVHHITPPDTVSYNEGQPLIIPAGSKSVKYYGNGCKYTSDKQFLYNKNTKTSYIEVSFTGTNIELWGSQGKNFGKVKVTVYDENNIIEKVIDNIDRYNRTKKTSVIAKIQGLKQGKHKVKLESTGSKHTLSSGLTFDFNKALVYPSVEYTFTGTGIKYYAWVANTYGKVDVIMDGGTPERIDLYANNPPKYSKCPSFKDDDYREREKDRDRDDEDDDWRIRSYEHDDDRNTRNRNNNDDDKNWHYGDKDDHKNDDYERCTEIVNKYVKPVSKMVKEYSGLTDTEHRITIEGTGNKNYYSKGFTVTFDKFENATKNIKKRNNFSFNLFFSRAIKTNPVPVISIPK